MPQTPKALNRTGGSLHKGRGFRIFREGLEVRLRVWVKVWGFGVSELWDVEFRTRLVSELDL